MSKKLNEVIGTMEYDGLIVSNEPVAEVMSIILDGQGALKRGTVLVGDYNSSEPITSTASAAFDPKTHAFYILAEDVDDTNAETPVHVLAYRTGHFAANKLITGSGYYLSALDKENMRKCGILVSDAIEI